MLRRAIVSDGDVVVTIKRRLLNASPTSGLAGPTAVNQDVVVLRPTAEFLPGFLAATLNSRIGKEQAFRNQTEQINPYLSVASLRNIKVPVVDEALQLPIHEMVIERLSLLRDADTLYKDAKRALTEALGMTDDRPRTTTVETLREVWLAERLDAEFFTTVVAGPVWSAPFERTTLEDPRVSTYIGGGATPAAISYSDEGIPIIKVAGISAFGTAEWRGDRVDPDSPSTRGKRGATRTGDILMISAAHHVQYIGKSGVVRTTPDGIHELRSVGELITIRPSDSVPPGALATYLALPRIQREIQRLVRGQSAHLYSRDLKALPVPVLPDELQRPRSSSRRSESKTGSSR